ncbi:MAG: PAS-domain containing protein [Rhizobiaceae bacterium]|nr:PAS-domain containing protein [Rhizobiaceae bacterium]MCV0407327.1 PAS-domain containing protein [Rhizobiaceae bacterium]
MTASKERRGRPRDRTWEPELTEDDLLRLLAASADWLWATDAEHRFCWLSEDFERLTGLAPDKLLGRNRFDFLRDVARESRDAQAHMEDLEARRPFTNFVYDFDGGNPAFRWVSVSGFARFDEDGGFLGYLGTARNLTDVLPTIEEFAEARRQVTRQKELEEALEQAIEGESHAERLMAALNVMDDAFSYYDGDDRLLLYNEAFLNMYGPLRDIIRAGVTFEEIVDAGLERGIWLIGEAPDVWKRRMMENRRARTQTQAVLGFSDGRFVMRREMRTDDGGRIGIGTDITAMKAREARIEQARAESEAAQKRLQVAIDALDDGFALWDADDRLIVCNKAFRKQFDFLPNLSEGRSFGEMFVEFAHTGVVPEAVGREEEWVAEHMAKRAEELDKEIEFRTHDGRWIRRRDHLSDTGDRVGIRTDITDMKRREAELENARTRSDELLTDLQRTIDAMDLGMVLVDSDLVCVNVNTAFYDIWKVTRQQVGVGQPFRALMDVNRHNGIYDVADADWEPYVEKRLAEIVAGEVAPREFSRADGRTLIYSVTPLTGGKRLISYFDVTEMKEREAALAEALERARLAAAVIDGIKDPVFVKDADLRFVLANKAFAGLFDMEPSQVVGKVAADLSPAEDAAGFEASERGVLETGQPYEVEEDFEAYGIGRSRIVRKTRVTTDGDKDYVAGFVFDVSEIRRREREVEEARERLAEVIEFLPAGVIIYDAEDRFVLANRRVQEALPAMVPAMKPGRPLEDAVRLAHQAGYFRQSGDEELDSLYDTDPEAWIAAYTRRYHVTHAAFERRNPDGRWFQVFDSRTADGTYIGVRVDITDLKARETELREAQRKAELADRAKSEFLANMSHEIRTPMNGVLGMAELLAKSQLDAKQKTFTDIIVKSGNALLTIINDILDFSKIDAGQLVLDPAPFGLAEAIEDVATLMSTRAKEKDIELIVRVQPGLPETVVGDVGRLRQIITNLMGNAIKFTEKGHVLVEVTGDSRGGKAALRFAVTDTGIGIPADKIEQVFEKFSQVDASSTRRHEGTGLGLAITSRLVALMGGRMGVESVEGEGSTFWFEVSLPAVDTPSRPVTATVDVSGARILVIDDNSVNRAILSEQMSSWSFDACAAESGMEGLAVLEAAARMGLSVDCVVLDYQMPGMNGAEVARAIRASETLASTPIIMLTSVDQSLAQVRNRELGIDAQLVKPARSSTLLETLVAAIQKGNAHRREGSPAEAQAAEAETIAERDVAQVARRSDEPAAPINRSEPATPPAAPEAPAMPDPVQPADHRVDILIAEDNEVNQLVFMQILEETGFTFEIVGNGRLAVEAWKTRSPRMILMDVSMPEMSGIEATGAIREAEAASPHHVPIVGVTAHALKGDRERCLEAGMDDYLSKPIKPAALLEKVERWLGLETAARNAS